jgi:hypothetical protein
VEVDVGDAVWAQQIGAALAEDDVARLLGLTTSEVARSPRLLRIANRDGGVVYPVVQFDREHGQVPGVADVVTTLAVAFEPLTIAAWLTGHNRELARRPIDALRDGDVDRVLALARQLRGGR